MKVTLFMPAINEIDGMRAVMPRVQPGWCDQILLVDGGSTDGTLEYAQEHGYDIYCQKRKGIRHGYSEAWSHIKGDIVITFSPDGNCKPEVIPDMINKMKEGYDMVVASRYYGGIKSEDDTWLTGFGNWGFTRVINFLYGAKYSDAMGIYRAYRTTLFHELDMDKDDAYPFEKLFKTVVGLEPLLSVRAAKRKVKIGEVSGPEPARVGGESKMLPYHWGAIFIVQILRELYYWRKKK